LRDFAVGIRPVLPSDQIGVSPVAPGEPLLYIWPEAQGPGRPALDRTFDKLTFRQGWEAADQYLLLDGLGYFSHAYADMNTVQEFSADGRVWLCEPDAFRGPTLQFHNGPTYVRDGLGPLAPQGWTELQRTASGERYGYTRTVLPAYGEADWVRHILWTRGQSFFVLDQLLARRPGDFRATLRWRSLGEPTLRAGRFDALQDDHEPGELLPPDLLRIVKPGIECINATYTCNFLLVKSAKAGDGVEFPLRAAAAGSYRLIARMLCTRNYGTVQAKLDGRPLGQPLDTCDPDGVSVLDLDLGLVTFAVGQTHALRLEVVASNPLSPGYGMSVVKLLLRPAKAPERDHNGFTLCFDRQARAGVEQDRVLGRLVVPQAYRRSVLNVLEIPRSRKLVAGQRLGLASFFGAWPNHQRPDWELRQIGENAALVQDAGGLRLFAAAGSDGRVQVGGLNALAEFVVLSPSSVVAVRGSRLRLGAEQLALAGGDSLTEQPLPAAASEAVAAFLGKLWQSWSAAPAKPPTTQRPQLPSIRLAKRWPLTAPATACAAALGGLVVGTEDGQLLRFGASGEPTGRLRLEGAIHALAAADLQPNGKPTLLVGTDAGRLYNVGPDLKILWDRELDYRPKPWPWYTMLAPKVCAIATGEGGAALGLGDAGLQFVDRAGQPLWYRETMYGPPACVTMADVLGRGKPQIIAGIGLVSGVAQGHVFDPDGNALGDFRVEGYGAGVNAMIVGALDSAGSPAVFCGASSGKVGCYRPDEQRNWQQVWAVSLGGAVRGLAIVPAPTGRGKLLVAVSQAGYVVALDSQGAVRWARDLQAPVLTETAVTLGNGKAGVAAAAQDGRAVVLSADGRIRAMRQLDDQPVVSAVAGRLIAIGGRRSLVLLRAP
jgi:outer membrane protein assembly factor BamB